MRKILFALLTVLSVRLSAQGIPSEGKDFYLGYIYPTLNDIVPSQSAGFHRVYAYVSSFQDNVVSVSYFDPITKKEGYPNNYPVGARQTTQITLDRTQMTMRTGDQAGQYKSAHVTAKKPINVQFFSTGANSGGSYLALPVNGWGKEYVVASYNDNGESLGSGGETVGGDKGAGVFMIIAAYDMTQVTITPTARTTGGHPGVHQGAGATGEPQPYSVYMNRGQCWLVRSNSAQAGGTDDISASIVRSDKPVAVIAGHENAMTGNGNTGGYNTEGRDFMVEQMIPVESWDHTGYITIPMLDSPDAIDTVLGDNVRSFVYDSNPETIIANTEGATKLMEFVAPYAKPAELRNLQTPAHYSTDSGKFMLMQYDLRNHGSAPPYPTPSMMSIVPRSHWRNAFQWYVPSNINEKLQSYYVTIIAPKNGAAIYYEPKDTVLQRNWFSDSLRVSVNGSNAYTNVNGLGGQKKKWNTIPGHPGLVAYTYSVSPGTSYYIKGPFPFMVYFFGQRAFSYDNYLANGANDYYLSFATPVGMTLGKVSLKRLKVTVDTLCSGWRVCVHDSSDPGGVKSVTLLDDPRGEIIIGGQYKYINALFDTADDKLNLKEIVYEPVKNDACFTVRVENPNQDAYAPLYIVDANGNGKIVELRYKRASVDFVPLNAVPSPLDSDGLYLMPYNTVSKQYEPSYIDEEICRDYLFINKKESSKIFKLLKAEVTQPSNFRVTNVVPPIGSNIGPDDTVRMTVCFSGSDTLMYFDSLDFATDCFPTRLPLVGHPGTPIIEADDRNFGTILVGSKKCSDVEVRNIGNKPFILDNKWVMDNLGNQFQFDTAHGKNKLPITIGPGQYHKFWFCYRPIDEGFDSTQMQWSTDIREPYKNQVKPFSILTGAGIKPGVNWDRPTEPFETHQDSEVVHRVNLINTGSAEAQLGGIWIDGPDAAEFRIVGTENNTNPPTWAGTVLSVPDTMWVDVGFLKDGQKPATAPRLAYLKTFATLDTTMIAVINLVAGQLSVESDPAAFDVLIRPNPARDRVTVDLDLLIAGEVSVTVFDILGREVAQEEFGMRHVGEHSLELGLEHVEEGVYYIRTVVGGMFRTFPLEIRR